MNKKLIGATGLVLVAAAVIGGGYLFFAQSKKSASKVTGPVQKIKVSGNFKENTMFNAIIDVAQDKGYFKDNNVEVEKVDTTAGTQLLATNGVDAAILVSSSPADLYLNGKDVNVVATLNNYIPAFHGVSTKSKDDLKGIKKIGVNKIGNADHLSAKLLMNKLGVTGEEYVLAADDKAKLAMLKSGQIDFAFIISYNALQEAKKDAKLSILPPDEAFDGLSLPLSLVSTKKAVTEKKDGMEGFVKAVYQGIKWDNDHKDDMVKFMMDKYKLAEADAKYIHEKSEKSRAGLSFVPTKEAYQEVVSLIGTLMKPADPKRDVAGFVYPDFARQAK